ncbi:hypothetical protein CRM22_007359 [Opisthorchis felineus]|uniref:Uncharacterized protein n=1 Tax=Opisthorchis felineus TaxID=147828 RepID=A0A4S2LN48_OPIFE|nr:hypothetical protein CRM22_007359 [Opisthorchis felineus]
MILSVLHTMSSLCLTCLTADHISLKRTTLAPRRYFERSTWAPLGQLLLNVLPLPLLNFDLHFSGHPLPFFFLSSSLTTISESCILCLCLPFPTTHLSLSTHSPNTHDDQVRSKFNEQSVPHSWLSTTNRPILG